MPEPDRLWAAVKRLVLAPFAILGPASAKSAGSLFPGSGFVDSECSAFHVRAIHLFNRRASGVLVGHSDKSETAGSSGVAIHHQVYFGHGTASAEGILQIVFGCFVGEVSNVEFSVHLILLGGNLVSKKFPVVGFRAETEKGFVSQPTLT